MKITEVMTDPDQLYYIARIQGRGKTIAYRSPPYPTREEAARDAFMNVPKAKSCSTARATVVNGEWTDIGGMNIDFHDRWRVMGS